MVAAGAVVVVVVAGVVAVAVAVTVVLAPAFYLPIRSPAFVGRLILYTPRSCYHQQQL